MTLIKLSLALRSHAEGQSAVKVEPGTVAQCMRQLESRYPSLGERLRDEDGDISSSVNLYVNGEDVRHLAGGETTVSDEDEVTVIVAIAGG